MDSAAVRDAMADHDIVFSFAGQSDIDEARASAFDTMQQNILGCMNQLNAAVEAGIERFVFASSIYVYSESGGFYRVSKQSCELAIEEYQRAYDLDYTILRYGTLYGRRSDERNSVYSYLRQALMDRHIKVTATGNEMREYIHVTDAARLSVSVLSPEYANRHVILTGHYPMRFRDLLETIREIVGEDVVIDLEPPAANRRPSADHYSRTPYTFRPKIGVKLVDNEYLDMGQGLLGVLDEIYIERKADE